MKTRGKAALCLMAVASLAHAGDQVTVSLAEIRRQIMACMHSLAPQHGHADILEAARRHGRGLVERWPAFLAAEPDFHALLGAVGAFGLLQQLLPDIFVDEAHWTDIFSDARLYRVALVEVLDEVIP